MKRLSTQKDYPKLQDLLEEASLDELNRSVQDVLGEYRFPKGLSKSSDRYLVAEDVPNHQSGNLIIKEVGLGKLLELLTDPPESIRYANLDVNTLLFTFPTILPTDKLFNLLELRYRTCNRSDVQVKVLEILKTWILGFVGDFIYKDMSEDDSLEVQFRNFVTRELPRALPEVSPLLTVLPLLLDKSKVTYTKNLLACSSGVDSSNFPPSMLDLPPSISPLNADFLSIDPVESARQLSLLESEAFRKISPREFLNQTWSKASDQHLSPNLLFCIERFNKFSLFVAWSVLDLRKLELRRKGIQRWIKIADETFKLHNYTTLMSIISGLSNRALNRKSSLWEKINEKKEYSKLCDLMDMENNYSHYRGELEKVVKCNYSCVPFIGPFLADLTFVDENKTISNGLVSLEKLELISKVVEKIRKFQNTQYYFHPVEFIQKYYLHSDTMTLNQTKLDELALECTNDSQTAPTSTGSSENESTLEGLVEIKTSNPLFGLKIRQKNTSPSLGASSPTSSPSSSSSPIGVSPSFTGTSSLSSSSSSTSSSGERNELQTIINTLSSPHTPSTSRRVQSKSSSPHTHDINGRRSFQDLEENGDTIEDQEGFRTARSEINASGDDKRGFRKVLSRIPSQESGLLSSRNAKNVLYNLSTLRKTSESKQTRASLIPSLSLHSVTSNSSPSSLTSPGGTVREEEYLDNESDEDDVHGRIEFLLSTEKVETVINPVYGKKIPKRTEKRRTSSAPRSFRIS